MTVKFMVVLFMLTLTNHGDAALIDFVARLVGLESAGVLTLHTPSLIFNAVETTGSERIGVRSDKMCSLHDHLLDNYMGMYMFNLPTTPSTLTLVLVAAVVYICAEVF